MDVSYSSNRYIEFNRRGVNKGAGLLNLAMLLGIRQEETIAIGDNYNDLSMIRAAGLGVGVANTVPEMKNQCDVITRATHEDGAVAEVIETYILNPADC
jgi:hydroxymethylpyrimidine pyrophosphatase-like HAD family hydrolase